MRYSLWELQEKIKEKALSEEEGKSSEDKTGTRTSSNKWIRLFAELILLNRFVATKIPGTAPGIFARWDGFLLYTLILSRAKASN